MLTDVEILAQLRKAYNSHKLSALVGAGFTKNAYPKSPDWWYLVKDLIVEAYDDELKKRYADYVHISKALPVKSFKDCLDDYVDEIISRDGYLGVVTKYIKKKGFREAIDVYIEEHNPYVYQELTGSKEVFVYGDPTPLPEKNFETHQKLLNCDWNSVFTTNYDNFLEFTDQLLVHKYDKVVKDYQLSQQNNKLIIKIHGDLVRSDRTLEEPFEFDNDKTRRYIISQEDYDTYFERHEAFSYYMRTALLTGYYCLIGFSGDDPNYKGWIEWVKDILDKDSDRGKKDEIKVFLIDFEDNKLSVAEEIFNQNHHIGIIHLFRKDILDILRGKPNGPVVNNRGEALRILFDYLNPGDENDVLPKDSDKTMEYNSLMGQVLTEAEKGLSLTDTIVKLKVCLGQIPFPKILFFNENVIDYYLKVTGKLSRHDTDAFILAFLKSGHMPSSVHHKVNLSRTSTLYPEWQRLIEHEDSLSGAETVDLENPSDEIVFENTLRELFHLRITQAKRILKDWNPTGNWIVRKVALNSMFVGDKEIEELREYSKKNDEPIQWRYFATTLYNLLHRDYKVKLDNSNFINAKVDGFYDLKDYLQAQTGHEKDDQRLDKYGEFVNTLFIGDKFATNRRYSVRLLDLFAETGFPMAYRGTSLISMRDWYVAFRFLLAKYPYACMYYCCQFGDSSLVGRFGQDFAYTNALHKELPGMLKCCLGALCNKDVPLQLYNGILRLSTELYVAVKEDEWYDEWMKLVKKYYVGDKNKYLYSNNLQTNIKIACAYLEQPKHISSTLTVMLNIALEDGKNIIRMYPGYLRLRLLEKLSSKQLSQLESIIENIPIDQSLFLLWRVYDSKLMPDVLVDRIVEKACKSGALKKIHPFDLIRFAMIVKGNKKGISVLKREILKRDIWSNGISGEWATDPEYVPITELPDEYQWTEEEQTIINTNLCNNFDNLKASTVIRDRGFKSSCEDLLTDMLEYVRTHSNGADQLPKVEDVQELLAHARDWNSIEDGLYSADSNIVDHVLEQLSIRIRKNGLKGDEELVDIAIEHALQQNIKGLTSTINLLSYIAYKGSDYYLKSERRKEKLLRVLKTYQGKDLRDYNMFVVTALHSFIYIAEALRNAGMKDDAIDWWLREELREQYNFRERYYWEN